MRFVIGVSKVVIIPLVFLFGLFCCLLATAISALVEFNVLKSLFFTSNTFLPLILVTSLEGGKLFLHFLQAALVHHNQSPLSKHIDSIKILKYCLIAFSLFCSLIFVANSLYGGVPQAQSDLQELQLQELNSNYDTELSIAVENAEKDRLSAIEVAKSAWENAQSQLANLDVEYRSSRLEGYSQEKQRRSEACDNAETTYYAVLQTARETYDKTVRDAETRLNAEREENLLELSQKVADTNSGDNEILRNFLLFIAQIFGKSSYSRGIYLTLILIISVIEAGFLEFFTALGQWTLAAPDSETLPLFKNGQTYPELGTFSNKCLKTSVGALSALFIFLIVGAVKEISYSTLDILTALFCITVSISLPALFNSLATSEKSVGANKEKTFYAKYITPCLEAIKEPLLKGIISCTGFIIIGIFVGDISPTISLSAFGIALGSSIGSCIRNSIQLGEAST